MPSLPTGTVTFLMTDIEGSTKLWERYPIEMGRSLARHEEILAGAVESCGGFVIKSRGEGDSLFAVFSRATDAVAASCTAQVRLGAEPWPEPVSLRVRMALHTGEAELRDGDYYGTPVNRCARLRAIGHGGQVLVSEVTAHLVRDMLPDGAGLLSLGAHRLKDLESPESIFQLTHRDLPQEFPPLRSLDNLPNNLPIQLTRFVGREREQGEVKRLLGETRLLTLTGPGGAGKTRLSVQVAADLLEQYRDGVWMAALESLADGELVPHAVALVLGVREEAGRPLSATLSERLCDKHLLLILDNCEHVVAACSRLADTLLRSCAHLRILATSREALGVPGERHWPVPPLSLPDPRRIPALESLAVYEAVQLFLDRACAAVPDFALTSQNAAAVVEVCHRLDGIPLAIELAAARVKVLPVEQIAVRLHDRFRLLTGGSRTLLPRQQTLRALVGWSHDLLSEPEQVLWRRLSVFAGRFTLEAAESVCAGGVMESWEVLDLLSQLVDKSLLVSSRSSGEAAYRMLETIRQFGDEKLREAGEEEQYRIRHRDWYLAFAERARPHVQGPDQKYWLARLELEHDNLRAALDLTVARKDAEQALQLTYALGWFWKVQGYHREGWARVQAALALPGAPTSLRAHVMNVGASFRTDKEAQVLYDEALAIFRQTADRLGQARTLNNLGLLHLQRRDYELATAHLTESTALMRELGSETLLTFPLSNLAWVYLGLGKPEQARGLLEEALLMARRTGNRDQEVYLLGALAVAECRLNRPEHAQERLAEATAIRTEHAIRFIQGHDDNFVSGGVALAVGDVQLGLLRVREYVARMREVEMETLLAGAVTVAAQILAMAARHAAAAALVGYADTVRPGAPTEEESQFAATLQTTLGPDYDRFYGKGRTLTVQQVLLLMERESAADRD